MADLRPADGEVRAIRQASLWVILAGILASYLLVGVLNVWLFSNDALHALTRASDGWINPNLPFFLIMTAVVVFGIVFGWGRLRPIDVGLVGTQWRIGLVVLIGLWLAIQIVALLAGGGLTLHPSWREPGSGYVLGYLLAMLLGTALFEESFFRGFLLPQLYLRFAFIASERGRLVLAIMVSALVFSPWHLPTLLLNQDLEMAELLARLASLIGAGVLLAILYLRTGNLFVAMVVHALVNAPTLLFASPISGSILAGALGLVLIVGWPLFIGRPLATPLLRFRAWSESPPCKSNQAIETDRF